MPISRLRLALVLGALVAFAPLSIDMYLPSFPTLGREFGAGHGEVQLTLAAYLLGLSFGQLLYGPLSDSLGRKGPLYFGISLYMVGSIACALAGSIDALIGMRLVQALGGCAGMVIGRAIVRDRYSGAEAARFFSQLMLVIGLAPILGPLAGSQMLEFASWRMIFWLLAAFGAACLLAVTFVLPETLPPLRRRTGGVAGALRSYLVLLGNPRFLRYAAGGGLAMAGMFAYIAGSPFVFIELHGVSPRGFGALFGINAAGFILASQVNGYLVGRVATERLLLLGSAVQAVASVALVAAAVTGAFGMFGLAVPLFVAMASLGFIAPNALALAMQPHPEIAGAASALTGTLQFGFGAMTGAIVGLLPGGTAMPFAITFAGGCLASAIALRIGRRRGLAGAGE